MIKRKSPVESPQPRYSLDVITGLLPSAIFFHNPPRCAEREPRECRDCAHSFHTSFCQVPVLLTPCSASSSSSSAGRERISCWLTWCLACFDRRCKHHQVKGWKKKRNGFNSHHRCCKQSLLQREVSTAFALQNSMQMQQATQQEFILFFVEYHINSTLK